MCSENKGADQLRGYREADLHLCFRICRLLVFPCGGSLQYFGYYDQQLQDLMHFVFLHLSLLQKLFHT